MRSDIYTKLAFSMHITELNLLTLKRMDSYDEYDKARDEAKEWADIKTMLSIDYMSAH